MSRVKDCPTLKKYGPLPIARTAFRNKKKDAKERNIEFNITFEEYYELFLAQGIDKNIRQKNDKNAWCLCRYNDSGPYAIGNIYLDKLGNNSTFRNINWDYKNKKRKI